MVIDRINALLHSCTTQRPLFPRSELYSGRWLLRLVLDWCAAQPDFQHPLAFPPGTRWFSEARLPTAFLKRYKGDRLAETHTYADGVIGHFDIGMGTHTSELMLHRDAAHFVVLEATLFAPLKAGLDNTRYYDQTACTVGCMVETLRRVDRYPVDITTLAYYVLTPQAQIVAGTFAEALNREAIRQKGEQRAREYGKEKHVWYTEWFVPTVEQITIEPLAWEALIDAIQHHDPAFGHLAAQFYQQCLEFN
ncbi:MAG: hypothetical protein K8S97_15170 [Anaerolineae bacterium]|nr:hypothetical protein [Anaerolineae bacterium]